MPAAVTRSVTAAVSRTLATAGARPRVVARAVAVFVYVAGAISVAGSGVVAYAIAIFVHEIRAERTAALSKRREPARESGTRCMNAAVIAYAVAVSVGERIARAVAIGASARAARTRARNAPAKRRRIGSVRNKGHGESRGQSNSSDSGQYLVFCRIRTFFHLSAVPFVSCI